MCLCRKRETQYGKISRGIQQGRPSEGDLCSYAVMTSPEHVPAASPNPSLLLKETDLLWPPWTDGVSWNHEFTTNVVGEQMLSRFTKSSGFVEMTQATTTNISKENNWFSFKCKIHGLHFMTGKYERRKSMPSHKQWGALGARSASLHSIFCGQNPLWTDVHLFPVILSVARHLSVMLAMEGGNQKLRTFPSFL